MDEPVLTYQTPARSRPWMVTAAIALWVWAFLHAFLGIVLILIGTGQLANPRRGTDTSIAWLMIVLGTALCLWGLHVTRLALGVKRNKERAAERALFTVQVVQWFWIFGYLPVAFVLLSAVTFPGNDRVGLYVVLGIWLGLHAAMLWTRKFLRFAIAERKLVRNA